MYTLPCVKRQLVGTSCHSQEAQFGALRWGPGGQGVQEGGDICMPLADSLHCTAGTNTI